MKLFVQYESICTDYYRSDEPYGDWSESFDFSVKGVSISSRGRWGGLAHDEDKIGVSFEAEAGDKLYVLWITYGQGDSFGHGSGYGEILWVFKDIAVAQRAKEAWDNANDEYNVTFKDEAGVDIELSNPGSGYFESLQSVNLDEFELSI